jgi:N-[(2S)-2-amino-2-carboxyethyl]-L-glutamate dehydrogenase
MLPAFSRLMTRTASSDTAGVAVNEKLLYLAPQDVMTAAQDVDALEAVREALVLHALGKTKIPGESYLAWRPDNGGDARSISMPGLLDGESPAIGVKIINANTANPASDVPRASGLIVLIDADTARPRCVMAASYISALRTAAVSVLASQILITSGASTAAIIGAGPLAREHCLLAAERIPQLAKFLIFDTIPGRAGRLCQELAGRLPPGRASVAEAASARSAIEQCDLLITCTTTRQAYVRRCWLKEGAVAINISLDDLCEEVLMSADRLYVDDWGLIADDEHRLLGHLARAGQVLPPGTRDTSPPARAATGTLGQLLLGRCQGRQSDAELCVVNPFGLAIEDVNVASRIYQAALRGQIGENLPFLSRHERGDRRCPSSID